MRTDLSASGRPRRTRSIGVLAGACLLTMVSGLGWTSAIPPVTGAPPPAEPLIVPVAPVLTPDPPIADSSLGPSYQPAVAMAAGAAVQPTTAAGRTPGTFAVSNSGAANYTLPIWTPPGVGAVDLELALVYNSRGGDGVLGRGWSMSGLSAISRCNRTWAQDGGAPAAVTNTLSDRFCLDGQQLKLVSGAYGQAGSVYATEIESFAKIVANGAAGNGPQAFTVTTRNGLVYEYGTTTDSKVFAGNSGTIRTWAVSRIRDRVGGTNGNSISITYANEAQNGAYTNGSYRVASISYPTTASGQGPFYRVQFSYSPRPATDVVTGWLAGHATREPNQLDSITIVDYGSGATLKRYDLGYSQGPSTNRLRLSTIQECSASTCFAPTTIDYQNGQSGWVTSATLLGDELVDETRLLPVDLNGDGITDLVFPADTAGNYAWYVRYGTASGSFTSAVYTAVTTAPLDALIPGDFAGKGRTDLLFPYGGYWYRLYWNGSALAIEATGAVVSMVEGSAAGATAADVNGDGLPDLIWHYTDKDPGVGEAIVYVQLNTTPAGGAVSFHATPGAWIHFANPPDTYWRFLAGGTGAWSRSQSVRIADFNGDGRADLLLGMDRVYSNCGPLLILGAEGGGAPDACTTTHSYEWKQLISTGSAFVESRVFSQQYASATFGLLDWDGDGCTDTIGPAYNGGNWQIYRSTCAANGGFAAAIDSGIPWTAIALAADWDTDGRQDLLVANGSTWKVVRSGGEGISGSSIDTGVAVGIGAWVVGDFDGDGLADLAWADQAHRNRLNVNRHNASGAVPDLATSFTDGFGVNQSPTYVSTARGNYTRHTDAPYPAVDYQGALYVVDQFTASDGTGSTYQNQFWYFGARVHAQGRGFEGFYAQRIHDTRNSVYTYDYVERSHPNTGQLRRRDISDGAYLLSSLTTSPGAAQSFGAGVEQRVFPYVATQTEARYDRALGGAKISEAVTSYSYGDGYGNPTQVATTTTDTAPGSPFAGSSWSTTTVTAYANNATDHCFGLPTSQSVTETAPGQASRTRSTSYGVDTSRCRITTQTLEPATPSLQVTTTLGFDTCGNVNSIQVVGANPNGSAMTARTTSLNYGTRCQLPESATNPLGYVTSFGYDYRFGVPTQSTDPNGITTSWGYDEFGRRTLETRPDGTSTAWAFDSCTAAPCWGVADLRFLVFETWLDRAGQSVRLTERFYDGFDRLRYDEHARALGVWTANRTILYDSLGRTRAVYQPRHLAMIPNGYRAFEYDTLGRLTAERLYQSNGALDRTTSIAHLGHTTTITDPLLHSRALVRDVTGRLRRVTDPSPGGTTSYDYDASGNLNRLEDAIGAVSSGSWNLRGFRTQWSDADRGSWTFSGNSLNERVGWTNARGQSFSATFDKLGRLTARTEPEGTINFTFGTSASAHNIGRLKTASGYGYAESHTYDGIGRLMQTSITTDQGYQYAYAYNALGLVDTITYPTSPKPSGQSGTRFKIQYGYSYGAPVSITDVTGGGARTLWSLAESNDYTAPTRETLANGAVSRVSGYRPWTNELTSAQAGASGSSNNRQDLAYDWDSAGNLTLRQDLAQGLSESFGYDSLNRVESTSGNAASSLTIDYDASGNILSKSDVGTYTYHATRKHAVTAAGSNSFDYDANGNATTRNGISQSFASFDLPTLLRGASYQSELSYGPRHERWKQVASYSNGTETTHYVGGLLDKVTATSTGVTYWRHYVPTPGDATVVVSRNSNLTGATHYLLTDHLGSTDAVLDENGNTVLRESFDAFGKRRGSNWNAGTAPDWATIGNTTRDGYTGHEMLDGVGLVHMNGRVYDPAVGRFLSVDPIIGDLADSQSVNPYAYVGNRPLSYTDPSGYDAGCVSAGWCVAIVASVAKTAYNFIVGGSGPPPPRPMALPGQSGQIGGAQCGPGASSPTCNGLILYAGVAGIDSGVPSSSWVAGSDPYARENLEQLFIDIGHNAIDVLILGAYYDARTAYDAAQGGDYATAAVYVAFTACEVAKGCKGLAGFKGLVRLGNGVRQAERAAGAAARGQIHHIATDKAIKSGFTEQFQRIFGRAGKSLQDPANKMFLEGHAGRHSPAYHQYVLDRLRNATRGLSGDAYTRALDSELGALRNELLRNPNLVRGVGL